jgi:ribonuclease BN (tRNA processing enzyme)
MTGVAAVPGPAGDRDASEVSLLVLGSASGLPNGERFCTSLALRGPDGPVLIDCGAPASTLLYRYGEDPLHLRAILLSHFHVDHAADLPLLVQQLWLLNERRATPVRVPVYGPPGTAARLGWLKRFYLMLPSIYPAAAHDPAEGRDAATGTRYALGPATAVEFFATTHFPPPDGHPDLQAANFGAPLVAYGMALRCAGRRIVYSGDSRHVDDVAPHLDGATLLVHELGHHDPADVLRLAAAHRVPRLLLTHLHPRYDRAAADLVRLAAAAGYRGDLAIAHDGLRLAL